MKIARWVFLSAGILGLLPVVPVIFGLLFNDLELLPGLSGMGLFFFVFLFQYVCWQIFFIFLSIDPERYRPMMILAFFVEAVTPFNSAWLYFYGYKPWVFIAVGGLVFALLFLISFWLTGRERNETGSRFPSKKGVK